MRPKRKVCNLRSLEIMGIPKKYVGYDLEDFLDDNSGLASVKKFCKNYLDNLDRNFEEGKGILFCGSNGVGKSMLACIILKRAYIHRYSGRRVTFAKYIDDFTASWSRKGDEAHEIEQEVFEKYKGSEFLVLEEIGKEIDSKIAKPILEDLLRYREEHSLPTIICSNMSTKEIELDYGNSITSLIRGNMVIIKMVGKDRRY